MSHPFLRFGESTNLSIFKFISQTYYSSSRRNKKKITSVFRLKRYIKNSRQYFHWLPKHLDRISSKILRCASYFQLSLLGVWKSRRNTFSCLMSRYCVNVVAACVNSSENSCRAPMQSTRFD